MRLWRIARWVHRELDGRGGLFASGRWHTIGRPVVYAASQLSLAALEVLLHTDPDLIPDDHRAFELDVPEDMRSDRLDASTFPPEWRSPAFEGCRPIGDAWLATRRAATLRVPSALIPEEHNFLINPLHPEARRITIAGHRPFAFDPRLLRRT